MKTTNLLDRLLTPAFCACLFCLVIFCGTCPSASAVTRLQPAQASALASQQFFCTTGYDPSQCLEHVSKLKSLLVEYAAGTQRPWTWIIVRSEDWEPLLLRVHLDRRSPAFTGVMERQTYLEESLFLPPSKRASELERDFGVPFEQLLSIAVSHELGHAVCGDRNEAVANRVAEQLRSGKPLQCGGTGKSLTGIQEMYLHRNSPGSPPWR
jgi:hypothetical protein